MIRKNLPFGTTKKELPLVPMKEIVVFPHMVVPFFAGRPGSIKAIETAMQSDRIVFLACQRTTAEDPSEEDIHVVGCSAKIIQILKLPDETIRVLAEGVARGAIQKISKRKELFYASLRFYDYSTEITPEIAALMATVQESYRRYALFNKKVPQDSVSLADKAEHPHKLADIVSSQLSIKTDKKIELLAQEEAVPRLENLAIILETENEILSLQNKINVKVKKRLEKNQREYYLNEQLKEINRELGKEDLDSSGVKEFKERLEEKQFPQEVREKVEKELNRLGKLQPMSPESGILRTYLEWLFDLPWQNRTMDNKDIKLAAKILDEDHFDMEKPKERVLDFIAVRQLRDTIKGPILCFVGPPGTGKTSLGKSVARALGRSFVRISLGGVRDEAEIRGHRKTYVGALPGKILQSMKKAGTVNPVFLLDEVDKISSDYRGDPASALLEVLDPEQNKAFVDHYLEVPYDLSNVMFITTANSIHTIPYPLRDRMEIIEVPGYTEYEKLRIAMDFIIPKQLEENGLSWASIRFAEKAVLEIIRGYTMESGVRNLEREIARVIRKIAREAVKKGYAEENRETLIQKKPYSKNVSLRSLGTYLGKRKYQRDLIYKENRPGLVYGLAWTEQGGTLMPIEVAVLEGNGELILTGNLGDVMKESAKASLSFIRSQSRKFSLSADFYKKNDIHIHVPEGAIPKDGPSAGITITAAILSALLGVSVNSGFAMTGEITLTGRVLAIGGVKEKVLAAHRNSMQKVLMPEANKKDVEELPREVTTALEFIFADSILKALPHLFPPEVFQ